MFEIDRWIIEYFKKIPFLNVSSELETCRLGVHLFAGMAWSFGFAHFHSWLVSGISGGVWIGYTAYKELWVDGHLTRLIAGTETKPLKVDLISDSVSKLIGMLGYLLT